MIAKVLAFLAEHVALLEALYDAIQRGAKPEDVEKAIRATAIAASDAEMHRELDP